ncbi:MAG: NADH-quinone oxidoreductase subunit A [Chthoniobacterales bacterium]|nr:NADH-quinone oxidoreductase subunit A [Chthoniobacterales bacterium]
MKDYLILLAFTIFAIIFPLVPIFLSWLWARFFTPPKPGFLKNSPYECGIQSTGPARVQFHAQYYMYGLIFLIFDVEILFLLPFATIFLELPFSLAVPIILFVLLLIEGLVWAWAKGVLVWK